MNTTPFPAVPRLESLHHRLESATGPDGQPLSLLDDLMVFLEDPPPDVSDRWQAGADLCAAHGIATSRMSIWRFYRAHVVQWRRQEAPPLGDVSEESAAKILAQARHLVSLRALESLHHPHLPPRVLVGLLQNENRRQELQLARDKFNDQLETKRALERKQRYKTIEDAARDGVLYPDQLQSTRKLFETLLKVTAAGRNADAGPKSPVSSDNTP